MRLLIADDDMFPDLWLQGRTELPCCLALLGGPVGPASCWAATSNVEVSHTTYPVTVEGDRREKRVRKSHKEEEREGENGTKWKRESRGPKLSRVGSIWINV